MQYVNKNKIKSATIDSNVSFERNPSYVLVLQMGGGHAVRQDFPTEQHCHEMAIKLGLTKID